MSEINIEQEYHEINTKRGWLSVYQTLGETALRNEALDPGMSFKEAHKVSNRKFNRYRDVNPYDHSRIVLSRGDTDYINANIVKHEGAKRNYILTQGPLPNTVGHFWLMVWEQKSKAILMLNKLVEKNVTKCHMYWPHKRGPDHAIVLEDVKLRVEYIELEDCSYYSKRSFKLTDLETDISREVLQFHYTTWPDFGVPSSPTAFLEFLRRVRASGALDDPECPPVVHCSAGIGRSGTFCLVDVCLVLIEQNDNSTDLNAQEILLGLRHYRTGLIQTADQLRFSYEAIIDGARKLRGQDPNSDYEEVPFTSDDSQNYTKEKSRIYTGEECSDEDVDDEPPPLPPPRGESLINRDGTIGGATTREIAERFITEAVLDSLLKDASETLIVSEKSTRSGGSDFSRPLPAIPNSESLDELMSDLRYSRSCDDGKLDNENAVEDSCPIGKPLPPLPPRISAPISINEITEQDANLPNGTDMCLSKNEKEILNKNNCNKVIMEDTSAKLIEAMDSNCEQQPLEKSPLSSPDGESDRSNLRRRVRLEKQTVLAEKVRDMKRKQQESERRARTKRFLLPIGLGLGGLCLLGGALYFYFRSV